ncbi:hypothetical protein WJX79_008776 [Trebouxia sp. C0005]
MSTTQSIKPDTGRPPVPDAAMDCEQNGHSHGLPSVKLQQPGPGQSKRSLQATLSQSFQPDTPEHPQDSLLHSVSATSMRSTGSGIDPQTMNTQDASQPEESAFAMSAQRASTKQQLHQQSNPSAANGGANMLDDMLPEHSLAAQMSSEALASSLQQLSQPAANTQVEELADDMMPEHSLAAQMSNADQVLPLEEKAATDMLPEHSLVAQMSIDEPQPDAGEEDSVASGTRQLPHVLTTIESGLSAHFSGGFTPPGVSPFSMAPFPLSRAGSEALPPQAPSPESRKRHRGKIYPGLEQAISDWARDAQFDLPAPMAQDLSSGLSSVSEEGSEEEGVTSAEPMEEDPQLLKLAATILSRSSSLYPGLEPSYVPPSSGPAGHPSSSQAPPPAQVIGKAILAAASMHGQASDMAGCPEDAAAQKIGEAVLTSAAVAATAAVKADHTAAGREAAAATRSPAPPASTAVRSPLIQVTTARADDKGDPQHEAGAVGSSQHSSPAGAKQAGRGAHADKVLKAHSRDLGQRQQLVHVKLHQGHPPTKSTEAASGKSFMDLKAEPAVADTHGFAKQAGAGSPSGKGVQGGLREAVSPTRDRMAQALRRRM